jgi:hypothetical protein
MNPIVSILMFFFPYKRKVTVWVVIVQALNYLFFFAAIVVYCFAGLEGERFDDFFAVASARYTIGFFIAMAVDCFVYDFRNRERRIYK